MDVRIPDAYKTETMVSEAMASEIDEPDEIEWAILASLEDASKKCDSQWDSFQPMLSRLKRIGNYDKDVFHVHELLSIYLYKYSYSIYESLTEETYQFINMHLKGIRFTHAEQETLTKTLNRLRYGP